MANNGYESFRLACDRCHSQKLKCSQNKISTYGGACHRCLRAKVPCTYSPRARSGRPSESKVSATGNVEQESRRKRRRQSPTSIAEWCSSREESPDEDGEALPPFPSTLGPSMGPAATAEMLDTLWTKYGNSSHLSATPPGTTAVVDASNFDADSIEDLMNGVNTRPFPFADAAVEHRMITSLLQEHSGMESTTWALPEETGLTTDRIRVDQTAIPSTRVDEGLNPGAFPPSIEGRYGDSCTQKLSALAVNLNQHLGIVSHGLWVKDNVVKDAPYCLGSYPIGDTLHLSQKLIDVLEDMCLKAGSRAESEHSKRGPPGILKSPELVEGSAGNGLSRDDLIYMASPLSAMWPITPALAISPLCAPRVDRSSPPVDVDTPTALLILNCYVSIIRINIAVFAHLRQYLCSMPSFRSSRSPFQPLAGLQFGELQSSNEAYTRTHEAFRMLLDMLGRTEEILNFPQDFRCVRVRKDGSVSFPGKKDQTKGPFGSADTEPWLALGEISSSDDGGRSSKSGGKRSSSAINNGQSNLSPPGSSSPLSAESCNRSGVTGVRLVGVELVEAALRQEALVDAGRGSAGLSVLCKNIREVKRILRQKMAL